MIRNLIFYETTASLKEETLIKSQQVQSST